MNRFMRDQFRFWLVCRCITISLEERKKKKVQTLRPRLQPDIQKERKKTTKKKRWDCSGAKSRKSPHPSPPFTSHFLQRLPHPSPGRLKALACPVHPPFPRESAPRPAWKFSAGTAACSNFGPSREPLSRSSTEERKRFLLPAAARTSATAVFLLDFSHFRPQYITLSDTSTLPAHEH